jgi:hypothetical protein
MSDLSLDKIDELRVAIEQATTVSELKNILDTAAAFQVFLQKQKRGKDAELKIAEYILRAERKLGQMLQAAKAAGQITHHVRGQHVIGSDDNIVRLKEVGISLDLSSRAQRIASVPNDEFEQTISNAKQTGKLSKSVFSRNGKAYAPKCSRPRASPVRCLTRA